MAKERRIIRVAGTDQNGTAATTGITSDAIPFIRNFEWSLNVWFTGLTYSGNNQPEVTIEVSNDTDVNSFRFLGRANEIKVPEYFEKNASSWKYFRVIYDPKGASAGTKNFDLILFT